MTSATCAGRGALPARPPRRPARSTSLAAYPPCQTPIPTSTPDYTHTHHIHIANRHMGDSDPFLSPTARVDIHTQQPLHRDRRRLALSAPLPFASIQYIYLPLDKKGRASIAPILASTLAQNVGRVRDATTQIVLPLPRAGDQGSRETLFFAGMRQGKTPPKKNTSPCFWRSALHTRRATANLLSFPLASMNMIKSYWLSSIASSYGCPSLILSSLGGCAGLSSAETSCAP